MSEVLQRLLFDYMAVAEEICLQAMFMDRIFHRKGRSKFLRSELGIFPAIEGGHAVIVAEPGAYTIGCVTPSGEKLMLVSATFDVVEGSKITGGDYADLVS